MLMATIEPSKMLVAIRDGIDANSNDKVSKTSMIYVLEEGDVKDAVKLKNSIDKE